MKGTLTATVDNKGRLALPQDLRILYHIEPGDIFFIKPEKNDILRLAKAENPFDILAKQAIQDSKEGNTITLEEFGQQMKKRKRTTKK
jgi:bifunctional DNA-binding transcriptional regulator/antitoxin component of YhaV-PrlF toxin-antitoxin module